MAKRNQIIKNWPKNLLQWGVLLALAITLIVSAFAGKPTADPEKYCPLGGMQALGTFLFRGSLPCSMSSVQIMMGLVLAAAVILFSKLFCGYLCPVGTVEDLLSKLRRSLKIKALNIKNGSPADLVLRIFKYILLFIIFYMTMTASELFCKNLDPYYAVATGFKGEITLWMSCLSLFFVVIAGFFVDRFWCKYLCPLGAISNTLKFWVWVLVVFAVDFLLAKSSLNVPLWIPLGLFCLAGYILEIANRKPRFQVLHVIKDESSCNHCGLCKKNCPYNIALTHYDGTVNHVDCTLCGECVAACPTEAIHIGVCKNGKKSVWKNILPAALAVVLTILGIILGGQFEVPTINETWGITGYAPDSTVVQLVDPSTLETLEIKNLTSVKCYGSSKAFQARLQKIRGTHGVKTFVHSHKVSITYDPKVISADKLTEEIYVPSHCRIESPDPELVPEVKVITIRTEHMFNPSDLNNLANQFRFTYNTKKVFGLDSEYACPLIVHIYMDPSSDLSEEEIREIVDKKTVDITNPAGEIIKELPVDFEFVRKEPGFETMSTKDYLIQMFDGFESGWFSGRYVDEATDTTYVQKRNLHYADAKWQVYEYEHQAFEKPIYKRSWPFLSNWLSSEEGVLSVGVRLNEACKPALQITFCEPMTADRLWEMMTSPVWKITYKVDDIREEKARITFDQPGVVKDYKAE